MASAAKSRKSRKRAPVGVADEKGRLAIDQSTFQLVDWLKGLFRYDEVQGWSAVKLRVFLGMALGIAAIAWAYLPAFLEMFHLWNTEPDYSHGFLIPPIALFFLWVRRDKFPGWSVPLVWAGLGLCLASVGVRYLGAAFFLGSLDGWSVVICLAGLVLAVCGSRVFVYSLPSILFLFFAVPLPFRIEHGLSVTLQGIATKISTWGLQLIGRPAIAEGNTIWLGDTQLGVEHACSGMRIFLGIFSLAFAYVVITRRAWWEKGLLFLATIPVALAANAIRIIATGLMFESPYVSGEFAKRFSHDFAGWVTIPLAALMFAFVLWYLKLIFREERVLDSRRIAAATKR